MASQTLDDMIAALMSMGFDFQDAQDAVQYGKISTQEAIEWILAGKPGYTGSMSQPPTLRLGNQSGSHVSLEPEARETPFSCPLPIPESMASDKAAAAQTTPSSESSAVAEPSSSDTDMEQHVVSRLHLTEERVASKRNFEEKERAEARRVAKLEKLQAKREHERVLKEIAEDRKINKMMRVHGPSTPTATPAASASAASHAQGAKISSQTATSTSSTSTQCSLQIRLPNGKQLRKKLDRTTTLGQLWIQVLEEAGDQTDGYSGFMQPFPRREFSASEMNKTLEQLGLVPSGSLVLKKEDADVTLASPERVEPASSPEAELEAEAEAAPDEDDERVIPAAEQLEPRHAHRWGRGRALDNPDLVDEDEPVDAAANNGNDADDLEQLPGFAQFFGHGGVNPQMFNGQGFGDDDRLGRFQGVGQRLVPLGAPGALNHENRQAADLAGEAAQMRLAQPPEPEPVACLSVAPLPVMQVKPLNESCMAIVLDRISDPVNPVRSLGPMPQNLSQKIISCLMERRILDPRTVKIFVMCYLQRLILDTYTYATNELLSALRPHQSLQTLSLHSCPLISDHGIKHIAALKNLKVLNLSVCKQISNSSLKIIAGLDQLHTLSLEETGVTDSGLIKYFAGKPHLKNLNLNRTAVTDTILPHLKNLEQLQLLCLEETKITSLQGIEELTSLTTLNVASTHITTDSLLHLLNHPTLTKLNFSNTDNVDGDTALQYLAGLKLRTLCLPDRHTVTHAGLAYITGFALDTLDLTNYIRVGNDGMEHVGKIVSLRTLLLSNTKVTDEGLAHLSNLIQLKVLYLDRTVVTDAGITVVKAFKLLSELSLSATNVTSHFLKQGVLHACQGLTKLNLSRTQVGDTGVTKLKLPHLVLLNLDCTRVHARVVDIIKTNCPSLKSVMTANLTPVYEEVEED